MKHIEEFLAKSEAALGVFGSKKWLSVYGDALSVIGIYKDEQQLIGGFYFLTTKRYGLKFLKLPPYTPHCGLFFSSESKNSASINNFSKEVMGEVCRFFSGCNSALTVLAFPPGIIDLQPFIWDKYKVVPNYTYRIDLLRPLDEIKGGFDPRNRNAISKALKEDVVTQENSLNRQQLFDFLVAALKAAGANVYEKELRRILLEFSDASNAFSMEAYKDNRLLGAVFCIYDRQTCYYLLGGLNKNAGIQGVNNVLMLRSIEKAKALGCSIFDFEGSMLKGVEKFFRSFGPQLLPYFTANKAKLPLELLLKFKKRELF